MTKVAPNSTLKTITKFLIAMLISMLVFMPTSGFADDWVADQLRGRVFMFDAGEWVLLERGDVISDDRHIRTTGNGRVTFVRGNESIEVSSQTQIRIVDSSQTKFTTVMQDFGTVAVEADVEQVQHFAVQTTLLAAVVKGTRFSVTSKDGWSKVDVGHGLVEVRDLMNEVMTNIKPGQHAKCQPGGMMKIAGDGELEPLTTFEGESVS